MLLLLATTALAFSEAELTARLDEVAPLRALRVAGQSPTITAAEYARVASGEVATGLVGVEGFKAKLAYGVGILDVGIDALWAGINDETNHLDLIPVTFVEVVKGAVCEDRRHVLMYLPLPLVSDRWWIVENRYNPALTAASGGTVRELAWESLTDPTTHAMSTEAASTVAGGIPIAFSKGAWLLVALDEGHTLGEYHSWVDPGGRVPAGPASMFASGGIEDTFAAMETYARKSGLQCLGR